ncbi:MAG: Alanine dehydrogenase 2 [Syntrophorhabdus sp. PtaU1.Bin050]|nr:MAG: Alanine dehydrogenase 2 [Syntrophorhabdus sp. PtaU1.Bin050]
MIIGVPKEIKEGENRVALTPAGVDTLVRDGHTVLVEIGAGGGSGLTDDDYCKQGAQIAGTDEVFTRSNLIVKVKEPLREEWPLLKAGQILFTYLHLASSEDLTRALLERNIIGIAYETVRDRNGRLPLLVPMSEVAGRMSLQMAMRFLEADYGGRGILVSGVPGVPPAEVVVLGCGVVGLNAAKVAVGLGAHVTILDIDHDRLKYVDDVLHGNVITVYSSPYTLQRAVRYADILIGAVLIPGARAPVLVTEIMISQMKPGSVVIDVSVDQGGSVETTHPTTHAEPTYRVHGVIHCGIPNMPASVPRTSTYALTNATLPYVRTIASKGLRKAAEIDKGIAEGINVAHGFVTHPAVAESFGMKWKNWDQAVEDLT